MEQDKDTKSDLCEVVVVGSCNYDMFSYVDKFPKPGETIFGQKFKSGFGGKGANQAVCSAILGATVAIVGKVGIDTFGVDTRHNYESYNINTQHLTTTETATGVATIVVEASGENNIIVIPG